MTTNNIFEITAVEQEQVSDSTPRIQIDTNNKLLRGTWFETVAKSDNNTFNRKIDTTAFSVLSVCQFLQNKKEEQGDLLNYFAIDKLLLAKYLKFTSMELEEKVVSNYNKMQDRFKKMVSLCLELEFYEKAEEYIGKIDKFDFTKINQLILANKIDANLQDNDGNTILHFYCGLVFNNNKFYNNIYSIRESEAKDFITKLIQTGRCDYNIQNNDGDTPLHLCSDRNKENFIFAFIKAGNYDFSIQNKYRETALHHIAFTYISLFESSELVAIIKRTPNILNIKNNRGATPLIIIEKSNPVIYQKIQALLLE
jgi:hypothetical protein